MRADKYLPEIASPANAIFASSSEKKNGLARVALLPRGGNEGLTRSREGTKKRSKIMDGKIIGRRARLG